MDVEDENKVRFDREDLLPFDNVFTRCIWCSTRFGYYTHGRELTFCSEDHQTLYLWTLECQAKNKNLSQLIDELKLKREPRKMGISLDAEIKLLEGVTNDEILELRRAMLDRIEEIRAINYNRFKNVFLPIDRISKLWVALGAVRG